MSLLEGKTVLVTGVLTDRSIAFSVARTFAACFSDRSARLARPILSGSLPADALAFRTPVSVHWRWRRTRSARRSRSAT